MTLRTKLRLVKRCLVLAAVAFLVWRGYVAAFGTKKLNPVPAAIAEFVCMVQAYGSGPGQAPASFGTKKQRILCPEKRGERPAIAR